MQRQVAGRDVDGELVVVAGARDRRAVRAVAAGDVVGRIRAGDVISEIVGPALATTSSRAGSARFTWRTARMGPPKVDLEDKEAVRIALGDR